MKKLLYIFILSFCFFTVTANNISVELQSVKKVEEEVILSMEIEVNKWDPKYKMIITPIIYNDSKELALEPINIVGKFKNISEVREGIANSKSHVLKRKSSENIAYEIKIPYEEWMKEISVDIEQWQEGCCSVEEERIGITGTRILHHEIIPDFSDEIYEYEFTELEKFTLENPFLHPSEEYDQRFELFANDKEKKSVQVYFKQGVSRIDINFGNNKEVLSAIEKAFKLIDETPDAELSKVMIAGFASPEGSVAINNRLADQRAKSVKEFIKTIMTNRYDDEIFEYFNGGKDWDGLLNLLALHPELEGREEAIEIIKDYRHLPDCNDRLKKINNGKTYAYMLKELYPQLRNAGFVQVYYDIIRTVEATLVTDEEGRSTWIDTESETNITITRLNEATQLMLESKFDKALEVLMEVSEDIRSFNHIGVCYMMKGEYDEAESWLNIARLHADPHAEKNLEQISIARKVER